MARIDGSSISLPEFEGCPLNSTGTSLPCALHAFPALRSLLVDRTDVCATDLHLERFFLDRTLYQIGNP